CCLEEAGRKKKSQPGYKAWVGTGLSSYHTAKFAIIRPADAIPRRSQNSDEDFVLDRGTLSLCPQKELFTSDYNDFASRLTLCLKVKRTMTSRRREQINHSNQEHLKCNKEKKIPHPIIMSTPGTSDDSIKIWLKTGDIEKLEEAVINGYGDQLRNKTSRIPKINHFLKQVPHFQSKIDAIHEAVAQGKLREVQSLLDRKKLAMCRSQTGASPLHTAVLNNQTSIAKYILEKFPTAIQARDNQGRTALHYAAVTSDEGEMYKILLEYGADKKATDMRGKIPEYYLQNPEEMPLKNLRDGAISKVTRRNDKRNDRGRNTDTTSIPSKIEVRMLIQKADLNKLEAIVLNGYGDRLLGESSVNSRVKEFLDQVPEFMIKVANLHTAAVEGSLRDVRNLLDRRTLAIARDPYGANVLHRSVVHNHHNIVKYLVHNYPETINTTDFDGRTPLHYSVAVEDERIYKTLIGAGADESIKDNKGNTAIYYKEHPEELDLLEMQNRINRMRSRMQAIKKSSSNHRQRYGGGLRVTRANIRKWIHAEDLEKLNQVVFEGHGTKLLVETSSSAKVKEFLKTVPNLIGTIRDVNQAAQEGNLAQLQEITDNKQLFLSKDIAGISPLHRAVIMGHRDISKYIVQECPDSVKAKDHEGKTPLHYAAALPKDDNFIYNMLLEAGGDIQQLDEKGKSPEYYQQHPAEAELRATMIKINRKLPEIHVSSYTTQRRTKPPSTLRVTKNSNKSLRGIDFNTLSPEHVTKLISKGDVDKLEQLVLEGYGKKLYGKTSWIEDVRNFLKKVPAYMDRIYAVHKATAKGDLRQVEELMDNKKLVIAKDERGLTPLHRAVKYGKTDIVKYMLQMYPEAVHVKDKEGRTPLHLAGMYKDRNVEYKLLENFGSDVTLVDSKSKTPQEYQQSNMKLEVMTPQSVDDNEEKEKPNDLTAEELEDENNINQWIANDDLDRLEQLIVDGKGDLLLGKSSSKEKTKDFLECVPTTMGKIRAIHNATVENDLRGLQSLLDKRVYASSRDSFGACPLHIALLHGHSDVIRYLGNGFPASLNVQDIDGRTPLHYAAVANDEGMSYRFLHKHGADPNIKDKSGSTPGHYLRGRAGALALDDLLKRYEEKKIPPRPPSVQTWQRPPTAEILRALTPDEEENENDESTATLTETQTQDESETHFDASPLTEDTKSDELAIASEETQSNDEQKDELNPENDKTKIDTDQAVDETPVTNTEEIAQESMEKSEEPLQESMEKSEEPPQEANEEAAQQPAQETSEKGIEEQPHEAPEEQTQKAKEEETEEPPEKDIEEQPQKTIKEATADTPQEETEETLQEATGETSQEATTETPQEGPGETPQETTEETPQETTEETPQEATGETLQEATGETPQEATVETPQEATGETPQEATVETPQEATGETPQEATVETPQEATVETPQKATVETPQEATRETPQEATRETPLEATVETPQEATRETPLEANKNLPKEISDKVINETSEEPSEKLTDENQTAESTELAAEPESVEKEPSTDDNNKKNEAHIAEVHKEQNEENVEESSKEMTEEVLKTNDDDHNTEIKVNEDTTEGNIENEPKQTADAKSEQNETATTEEETEEHITTAAMETLNEESIAATETKSATEETAETEAGHETPTKTNDNSKVMTQNTLD
uniref:Uncharacterized protein n=1 Tax=Strigamia maritima TaxID=126957 RepID=T1IVP2_STRMM